MDNLNEPTGALDLNQASEVFASLLNPVETEPVKSEGENPEIETEKDPDIEEEVTEPEANAVTVEVDGKTVTLTPEQIAEAYKNGLRQEDYTRKTQQVAEERRAAEAETAKAAQERVAYAEKLNNLAIQLEGVLNEQSQIDWNGLLERDPVEYLKQQHLYQTRQAQLNQAQQAKLYLDQQSKAEQAQALERHLTEQHNLLIEKLPAWKDPAKASAERTELANFLKDKGFTEQDISTVTDHRHVLLIRNAMQFEKLLKQAPDATKRVQTAPVKVERSGQGKADTDESNKIMTKIRRSSSISLDEAAAAFKSIL